MGNILPTVGRMVYYKTRGSADGVFPPTNFAAIITEVTSDVDGIVSLVTFGPSGLRFEQQVSQAQSFDEVGVWDWMPFQKDQQARLAPGTEVLNNSAGQAVSTK